MRNQGASAPRWRLKVRDEENFWPLLVGISVKVIDYREHTLGMGADAAAAAYMEVQVGEGASIFGVGRHSNIVAASLAAVLSAVSRAARRGLAEAAE